MTRTTSRTIVGAAVTLLLGSFAVVPAVAEEPVVPTVAWTIKGFYGSVKENGAWNTRKSGSTIPLKFKIYDGDGDKSKTVSDISSFIAAPIPCVGQTMAVGTATTDLLAAAKKGVALKYRDGAFHKNWKTSKVKATTVVVPAKGHAKAKTRKVIVPSCYQVTMTAVDGQSLTALFKLK